MRLPFQTQQRQGKSRLGLWVGILGSQFLILAMYLTIRRTKKNSIVMGVSLVVQGLQWGPLGLQVREIAPLVLAQVGQDQNRVVGGDTGPLVPQTAINNQFARLVQKLNLVVLRCNRFSKKLDLNTVITRTIWVSMDSEFSGEQMQGGI